MIFWIILFTISNTSNSYLPAAESLYLQKDYYSAATEYERFLFYNSITPINDSMIDNIRLKLAECYYNSGEYNRAQKIVGNLIEQRGYFAQEAQLLRTQFYIKEKQYFRAKIELNDLLIFNHNPEKEREVYNLLGYIALQEREFDEASKYFNLSQDTFLIVNIEDIIKAPKKNVVLSQVMSTIIPGSGEIYSRKYGWGVLSLLVNAAAIYGTVNCYKNKQYLDASLIFTLLFTRFYNGSRNNARDFALEYNKRIYQSKIKEIEKYINP